MKPTAKAATPWCRRESAAITGRSAPGRRRARLESARRSCRRAVGVPPPRAPPAGGGDGDPAPSASSRPSAGDDVDEHVLEASSSPSSPGSASTRSPNWATSALLISSFERQRSIRRWMYARSRWACGASVGERERGAADRSTSPRPRRRRAWSWGSRPRARRRGTRERARQRRQRGGASHVRSSSSGRTCSRMNSSSTGPALHGGDAARCGRSRRSPGRPSMPRLVADSPGPSRSIG